MELNREQIIKALECCQTVLAKNALALIKELTEKNEGVYEELEELRRELDRLRAKKIKPLAKRHPFRRWLRKLFGAKTLREFGCIDEMHEYPGEFPVFVKKDANIKKGD